MKLIFLFISLYITSTALGYNHPQDTILPSQHKFTDQSIFIPKISDPKEFVTLYMEYLKKGKKTIGFVHPDELAMIDEKKLTEKKFFLSDYKIISIDSRHAVVKTFTAKGVGLSCAILNLRYYKNMYGFYYLVPGKVSKFEKKVGDITLQETYIDTWTQEKDCN